MRKPKTGNFTSAEMKLKRRCRHGWWCRNKIPRRLYRIIYRYDDIEFVMCNFCLTMKKTSNDTTFMRSILAIEDVTDEA